MKLRILILTFLLAEFGLTNAATIIQNNPGQNVLTIDHFLLTGNDMFGMQINVNGKASEAWNAMPQLDSSLNYQSFAADWSLSYNKATNSTFAGQWTFTNNGGAAINTIKLDAFSVNAVFDKDIFSKGTPGSNFGFFLLSSNTENTSAPDAVFNGIVSVGGNTPVGDLYRWLTFDFTQVSGLAGGDSFKFIIDSDSVAVVPLPGAFYLFMSALFGLFGVNRKSLFKVNWF